MRQNVPPLVGADQRNETEGDRMKQKGFVVESVEKGTRVVVIGAVGIAKVRDVVLSRIATIRPATADDFVAAMREGWPVENLSPDLGDVGTAVQPAEPPVSASPSPDPFAGGAGEGGKPRRSSKAGADDAK